MRSAKETLIQQLAQEYREGKITAVEHQEAYDILKDAEEGHDILYLAYMITKGGKL